MNADDVAAELRLNGDEALILSVMQLQMMRADVDVERNAAARTAKERALGEFEGTLVDLLGALPPDAPAWCQHFGREVAALSPDRAAERLRNAPRLLAETVEVRSRALLLYIELVTFEPWAAGLGWHGKRRTRTLDELAVLLHALDDGDARAVDREYDAVVNQLRRRSVRWGRVAVVGVVGVGLGVVTGGMAAPLVGAAIGSAAGLSGAAATSAGLATLGGGSIAAGGFGVAGGTALITSLSAVVGAGAGAAGSRLVGWSSGQVVADTVRLHLVTAMVLIATQHDDEKARRVVEGLQARLVEVTASISTLGDRLRSLTEDNVRLTAENKKLRSELQDQQAQARVAETALEIVLDRLPAAV